MNRKKFTRIILLFDIVLVVVISSLFLYGSLNAIEINNTISITNLETHINNKESKLKNEIEIDNLYNNTINIQKYIDDKWETIDTIKNTNIESRDLQKYNKFTTTLDYHNYDNSVYEKYRIYIPEYNKKYWKGIYPIKIHVDKYVSDDIDIIIKNLNTPEIASNYGCIMDDKGNILFGKKETKKAYPASITKMTTFALSYKLMKEQGIDLNDTLKLSQNAINTPYTYIGETNDRITYDTAFKAMMILSSNGTTVALAEAVTNSSSPDEFIDQMNKFVKEEVKVKNTHYENTHGLHEDNHYSTAKDICKIAKWNMKNNEVFTDYINIYETKEIVIKDKNNIKEDEEGDENSNKDKGKEEIKLHTTNSIVEKIYKGDKLFKAKYIGGKTGTEDIDGSNLISIIEWKDNIYYVCTLQAKNGATREKDQVKLIKWIENNV